MSREILKSILLISLIGLSIFLTYRLWFGKPPLEEGAIPRYERMYFTPPPAYEEILQPSHALFYHEEEPLLVRRGDEGMLELWEGIKEIQRSFLESEGLQELDPVPLGERPPGEFQEVLRLIFDPPVPADFFSMQGGLEDVSIDVAILFQEEGQYYLSFEGEEIFWVPVPPEKEDDLLEMLEVQDGAPQHILSDTFYLALHGESCEFYENDPVEGQDIPEAENEGEGGAAAEEEEETEGPVGDLDGEGEGGTEQPRVLEIAVPGELYAPAGDLWAAPVGVNAGSIDKEQLVRAFFYDMSMARQIEERDGARYFTDGERGLRVYPHGLMEYAAPRLEHGGEQISYSAALQQAIESLGLYGGWQEELYLVKAERRGRSYSLEWRLFYRGLPFEGEGGIDEMILTEQGITYYRRYFYEIGEETSDRQLFRSHKEALCRAVLEHGDKLEGNELVLHALRPVYLLDQARRTEQAVPAWKIAFEGMETIYLHWSTLEVLSGARD